MNDANTPAKYGNYIIKPVEQSVTVYKAPKKKLNAYTIFVQEVNL
jgi:hypothetical protein